MSLKWSEETLERFYNLHENFREHFDEERAKEIAKWLREYQEEVYLDKLLEKGLSHEEAWEIARKQTRSGVSVDELTKKQLARYSELRLEFSDTDAIDIAVMFTEEQKKRYIELLEDAFGPDDAWSIAWEYDPDEVEDDNEQPIPDGYSGEGFLESLEDIEYELNEVKATRSICRRFGRNGKEKQEQLHEYDQRISRLEHLLKNFENTAIIDTED